ncbi:hypothetical protein CYCD_30590 [Tenuifilaceae bacterium CYCD]|nr:hypothetical protein CYCD_30590 [Tenuifilaceae bacterium CYCD]
MRIIILSYIIPSGFEGTIWIAFNQPNGINPVLDSLGNAIIEIPNNGLLQTTMKENALATANKNYRILERLEKNIFKEYKTFDKFDKYDSTYFGLEDTIAIMCGFNQTPREDINRIFGKKVEGNVMTIYIGKYPEERKQGYPWSNNF